MSGPTWTSTQPESFQHAVGLLFSATARKAGSYLNPVFGEGDQWFFYDETWTDACGPYPTEQKAQEACLGYARTL